MPLDDIRPHDAHVHLVRTAGGLPADGVASTNTGELIAAMDAAGVEKAAAVVPQPMGWDNSPAFQALEAFPGRFVVIAKIDVRGGDAVARLTRLLDDGAQGIRLTIFDDADIRWISDGSASAVFDALAVRHRSVAFHCRPDQLGTVGAVAAAHPDVIVFVDHLGRPDVQTGPDTAAYTAFLDLARYPNVLAKSPDSAFFSAVPPPYSDLAPFLERAMDRFGAQRILWGSDWPINDYAAALEPVASILAAASASEQHAVLRGNFERIFCS